MIVKYTCKFCGKPESVEIEDNDATMFCVQEWAKILCCNRCGDFQVAKRRISDAVKASCVFLIQCRTTIANEKRLAEVEAVVRSKLSPLARKYSEIAQRHWKKKQAFDESMTDELIAQPGKCQAVLNHCEYVIRRAT